MTQRRTFNSGCSRLVWIHTGTIRTRKCCGLHVHTQHTCSFANDKNISVCRRIWCTLYIHVLPGHTHLRFCIRVTPVVLICVQKLRVILPAPLTLFRPFTCATEFLQVTAIIRAMSLIHTLYVNSRVPLQPGIQYPLKTRFCMQTHLFCM